MEVDESPAEAPTAQTDARETDHSENEGVDTVKKTKLKSDRKDRDAPSSFQHEVGRSAFPITRVQKILKADKELPIIAREAVFAISVATEEFIKQICSASQKQAEREKRTTVQKKDIVTVSKRAEEYWFLEGMSTNHLRALSR
ncbi:hypothetical protein SCHPADRAFT_838704 [Schizopora paradoxa]|uniref:Transcription factor CBF/NF-Y/archaeal histone domain-containing protein n=1 Tax=Schizopora paradoxa TaxID=27342 RepID=A0A0H2R2F4_9AGAM|nr:hypothetical protein SCHPADRAFT_838704 [Schizopora paradoxa]